MEAIRENSYSNFLNSLEVSFDAFNLITMNAFLTSAFTALNLCPLFVSRIQIEWRIRIMAL